METIRKTHPLMLGAAASVMVVSLMGAAAISGILPSARSDKTEAPAPKTDKIPGPMSTSAPVSPRNGADRLAGRENGCASCGTVEAIRTVEIKGAGTGLGAVAGGVTGAVVGNQICRGNGNTAMTILGAAGGAFAGNDIEKNVKKRYSYRITVRMEDGSYRTVSQSVAPAVAVGERVRIVDGAVVGRS